MDDVLSLADRVLACEPATAPAAAPSAGRWSGWRVAKRLAALAVLGAVVVELLLHANRSTSALELVFGANLVWVAAILVAAVGTYVMAAICTIGSSRVRLGATSTFVMQVASSFANRLVPGGVAGAVLAIRFIERAGARRSEAVASGAVNNAAGLAVHVAMFAALLPFFGGLPRDIDPPDDSAALLMLMVALTALGAVVWMRWVPRHWKGHVHATRRAASAVVRSPARLALLVGGSCGITVAHGLGLWAALRSVNAPIPLVDVLLVYLVSAAVGSMSPTPSGLGAIEVALVSGLTRTGAPAAPAAAAVLIYRFVTYWLPVVPGFVAFRWLRRNGSI